jgi:hypothetical protein
MGPIRKKNDSGADEKCKKHMLDRKILESTSISNM